MITVGRHVSSSNVQATLWCLAELGLEYDRIDTGFVYGDWNCGATRLDAIRPPGADSRRRFHQPAIRSRPRRYAGSGSSGRADTGAVRLTVRSR